MHAIKRGWFGQTFAIAKSNDFDGRKSRIRRSKEERKAMVESFIKKYQRLNNGSFPSLNLTHKEVGGSFYTVREIVRDVIQENRVLGPAKFDLEDQVNPQLEQGPLGSIALDPHYLSNGHQKIDNKKAVNGTRVESREEEHSDLKDPEIPEFDEEPGKDEYLFSDEILANVIINNSQDELKFDKAFETENYVEDVKVETFPVMPLDRANDMDGKLHQVTDIANTFSEQGTEKVELFTGIAISETDGVNSEHDTKTVTKISDPPLDKPSRLVDEEVGSSNKGSECDVQDLAEVITEVPYNDLMSEINEQSVAISGLKTVNSPNDMKTNYRSQSTGTNGQLKTEAEPIEKESDAQHGDKPLKEANVTLNRINLSEAWESSEKSRSAQTNPLLAAFKALIKGFLKFWME